MTIDVQMDHVSFSYGKRKILDDISIKVPKKEFLAVIGPNGGGKTTLLKLILGLLKPDSGTIKILGERPERAVHRLGYVPQDAGNGSLFPVTVLDTVLMGCTGSRRSVAEGRRSALESLKKVGMEDHISVLTNELSLGQKQRVMIARALTTEPEILLLDEPTASVDLDTQKALYDTLLELNRDITVIIVSHDLFAVTSNATAVACVNRRICYHNESEIKPEMLELAYGTCPVELIAHGIPHRVLGVHSEGDESPDA